MDQATFAWPGLVKMPNASWFHACEPLECDAALAQGQHRPANILYPPPEYRIGRTHDVVDDGDAEFAAARGEDQGEKVVVDQPRPERVTIE